MRARHAPIAAAAAAVAVSNANANAAAAATAAVSVCAMDEPGYLVRAYPHIATGPSKDNLVFIDMMCNRASVGDIDGEMHYCRLLCCLLTYDATTPGGGARIDPSGQMTFGVRYNNVPMRASSPYYSLAERIVGVASHILTVWKSKMDYRPTSSDADLVRVAREAIGVIHYVLANGTAQLDAMKSDMPTTVANLHRVYARLRAMCFWLATTRVCVFNGEPIMHDLASAKSYRNHALTGGDVPARMAVAAELLYRATWLRSNGHSVQAIDAFGELIHGQHALTEGEMRFAKSQPSTYVQSVVYVFESGYMPNTPADAHADRARDADAARMFLIGASPLDEHTFVV
jgi:hypothetical protein